MARKPSVHLRSLDAFGPILVRPTADKEGLRSIVESQKELGGVIYARIEAGKIHNTRGLIVGVRWSSFLARIGLLDREVEDDIRQEVFLLRIRGRAARCEVEVVDDPEAPDYLDVWLNPSH
ncbi:MAG: hypothetical protein JWQ64_3306 [Subtercola sp.]|jgi:hypothetical protein|nr:hypothetical protein [Subtercola sp.]